MIELYHIPGKVSENEIRKVDSLIDKTEVKEDIVIALGGDGTFLETLKKYDKPVLPIGKEDSLAFHADNNVNNLEDCLEKLTKGQYEIDEIKRLDVYLNDTFLGKCVNDYYIKTDKTIDYEVTLQYDKFRARGDGIIVFTPIGSTGYNRAIGGPKIDFRSKVIGVSQIATCSLNDPLPYIIPEDQQINIEIKRGKGNLYLDGEEPQYIEKGDTIESNLSDKKGNLIRINNKSVSEKLFRKQIELYEKIKDHS